MWLNELSCTVHQAILWVHAFGQPVSVSTCTAGCQQQWWNRHTNLLPLSGAALGLYLLRPRTRG